MPSLTPIDTNRFFCLRLESGTLPVLGYSTEEAPHSLEASPSQCLLQQ